MNDNLQHDPGGKSRFPLKPYVHGDAWFSEGGIHRLRLERWTKTAAPNAGYALFIGMNPSEAGADFDDPTVRREWLMTVGRFGLSRYVKMNVMTRRETHPERLLGLSGPELVADGNTRAIQVMSERAHITVACWGLLPKELRQYSDAVSYAITGHGSRIVCLGKTADGSPRHGRGVVKGAPLVTFP